MTHFEIAFLSVYLTATILGLTFVAYVLRYSVRDRPSDPEAVNRLLEITRRPRPGRIDEN